MSLSTAQDREETSLPLGTVPPDEGTFWRSDWLAAALVTLVSLVLYVYTLMPNVGLQDSGELVTAAATFGVPHPPGYPFWSLTGFILTKFLPIENLAWRCNLLSAIFGAGSCMLLTLLVAASSRWLLWRSLPADKASRARISFFGATAAGMILAFSETMWGQAVHSDHVRTQNSFLLMLTFLCVYKWILAPEKRRWLLGAIYVFCLGVTNHPTVLMTAPAFLVPVFLVNRRFFFSFLVGYVLLVITAMGVLAWYSGDGGMEEVARRLAVAGLALIVGVAFWHMREFRLLRFLFGATTAGIIWLGAGNWIGGWFVVSTTFGLGLFVLAAIAGGFLGSSILDWKFATAIVLVGWLGLIVFAKTQISSATNPPMNWSYARDNRGLYQSIIRGQYSNNLAANLKRYAGPLLGYHAPDLEESQSSNDLTAKIAHISIVMRTMKMYMRSLEENLTLPICLLVFPLFLYFGHLDTRQRPWVYFMILSFALLAFTLTFVDTPAQLDIQSWLAIKPFHILSHCMFVLAIGYGLVSGLVYIQERMPELPKWALGIALFTALLPLQNNVLKASRRDHWFGWQYGTDMLRPLDRNAVVYGGTDPGRFVPTYMIFCESQQPAQFKRDPSFDRSDLYIITQNALADIAYLKYIRDHYDDRFRPKTYSRFERWLGRDHQYPKQSLQLLDDKGIDEVFSEFAEARRRSGNMGGYDVGDIFRINGLFARKIFEQNKKDHSFYIEESLPIDWMYDYMVPAGLLMKLNPEPLTKLPPAMVAEDRKFWDGYTARLLADPHFALDFDARQSFSKLRNSFGNMYRMRGMIDEALYVYQQALTISPLNGEVVDNFSQLQLRRGNYDEAEAIVLRALQNDPRNDAYKRMLANIREQREISLALIEVRQQIAASPRDYDLRQREAEYLARARNWEGLAQCLTTLVTFKEMPYELFVSYIRLLGEIGQGDRALPLLSSRMKVEPTNADLVYNYAAMLAVKGDSAQAKLRLRDAIQIGGKAYVDAARGDERFASLTNKLPVATPPPKPKR